MAIEIFNVEWTKPEHFNEAISDSSSKEGGIYAIYRPLGSNLKLHYIGKSKDFFKRSSTHRNMAMHTMTDAQVQKFKINFGLISCFDKSRISQDITPAQLSEVESYFINKFMPIGNDPSTKKGYKGNTIIIFNTGKRQPFNKILSNCPELIKFLKSNLKSSYP